MLEVYSDPKNATSTDRLEAYSNAYDGYANPHVGVRGLASNSTYRVGWNTQNLNDQWKGKIFEIIIFDRILGSDDRVLMQNYFERKYKVQLN